MMYKLTNVIDRSAGMTLFNSKAPTFIITMDTKKICEANDAVISSYNNQNPIGKEIDDIIHVEQNAGLNVTPAYFNEEWFVLTQETLIWDDSQHIKVQLKPREGIPDFDVMKSLKNMIGFLLHRVRSPLTGIQGYADLLETSSNSEESSKYLKKINNGIDELFDLLAELDALQEISLKKVEVNNFSADPAKIIQDILSDYSEELKENITFENKQHSSPLRCNPGDMRRILSFLIENAVEYAPAEENEVTISQPSPNAIKVAHNGNPIPRSISKQLFYPFVTSKARKLGIGLTMAILYAQRYKGSIFVTDNNSFRETSFLFCLPPSQYLSSTPLL